MLISITLLINPGLSFGQRVTGDTWGTDYSLALKKAQGNGKNILLSFSGSDWCKPCILFSKEILHTEEFLQSATKQFELVQADFPRLKRNQLSKELMSTNESLAKKFNPSGEFPLVLVIDKAGNVLYSVGYQKKTVPNFISQLQTAL